MNNTNLEKRKKFTTETARNAQKKSVVKRKFNKTLFECMNDEGNKNGKDKDGKMRPNKVIISKKIWDDAKKGNPLALKFIFNILGQIVPEQRDPETDSSNPFEELYDRLYSDEDSQ